MEAQYNRRSPAVKRLMKEAQELSEATEQYYAQPLDDNLFEWHFTIRGPADSEFDGGLYHGRIILPADYPMKPPSIILLTANGRFETHKKICLSISGHHPESWQPSWSIRTALLAIIGFMPTHGSGAIGSLDYTPEERKVLAKRSTKFHCPSCGHIKDILKPVTEASTKTKEEAKELAKQISFQPEKEKKTSSSTGSNTVNTENEPSPTQGASANVQSSTNQPGLGQHPFAQRFPMFPPMAFPGFSPGMFRPPTTSTSGLPPYMPPNMPFWPGASTTQQSRMPFPPFPPNFMMSPGFMQTPVQQSQSRTASISAQSQRVSSGDSISINTADVKTASKDVTSNVQSETVENNSSEIQKSDVQVKTRGPVDDATGAESQSTGTQRSESNSEASQPESASTLTSTDIPTGSQVRRQPVRLTDVPPAPTPSQTGARGANETSHPDSTSVPTSNATAVPADSEIRRRLVDTLPARQPLQAHARDANAPAQTQAWPARRHSANPCAVGLMIVIAFALILLIIRRLIMMKILKFDIDF